MMPRRPNIRAPRRSRVWHDQRANPAGRRAVLQNWATLVSERSQDSQRADAGECTREGITRFGVNAFAGRC